MKLDGRLSDSYIPSRKRGEAGLGVVSGTFLPGHGLPALAAASLWCRSLHQQFYQQLYAGGFLHENDIRTLATGKTFQVEMVKEFADQNLLKLNISKCELDCVFLNTALYHFSCVQG